MSTLCRRSYTPEPQPNGYDEQIEQINLKLYIEGNDFRCIERHLSVNRQSVVN